MKKLFIYIYRICVEHLSRKGLEKYIPIISVVERLFAYFLKKDFVEIKGHKIFLDRKDSLRLSIKKVYEPLETEIVENEVKPGDFVLDIGANIGYFTLIFARFVGDNGKVFAFEPEPITFKLLEKNIQINNYKNVILEQKAVSDKRGKLKLYISEENNGDHRIYESVEKRNSIEIESVYIDGYLSNQYINKIKFIKMDIQGAEGLAIQGMKKLLETNEKIKLLTEFAPCSLKICGTDPKEFLEILLKLGFKLYYTDYKNKKVKPVNINYLLKEYSVRSDDWTTLFCIR